MKFEKLKKKIFRRTHTRETGSGKGKFLRLALFLVIKTLLFAAHMPLGGIVQYSK